MYKKTIIATIILAIFLINVSGLNTQTPLGTSKEIKSPNDHIKEEQIHVYKDKIVIDIEDATWARFTDTNSMDPVIDINSNSIEIKPKKESQLKVGDIISFKEETHIIVHRIILIDYDQEGWYAVTKGDNNEKVDPNKVRFKQIHGIVIAIIY